MYCMGFYCVECGVEMCIRAPALIQGHVNYNKKVVFPLEIVPWMVLFGGAFKLAIGSVVLLVFYLFFAGLPPPSAMFVPIILLPLALFAIGFVWFLSAFGVYVRDIKQVIGIAAPITM